MSNRFISILLVGISLTSLSGALFIGGQKNDD